MQIIKNTLLKAAVLFFALFFSIAGIAQEGTKIDVDINKNGGGSNWYTNPIVWVVGGAVFILLLVALLRGGGNRSNR